ncbi:MAG: alpha-2-macroglobulin family protein [Gemmataceae bacterium]
MFSRWIPHIRPALGALAILGLALTSAAVAWEVAAQAARQKTASDSTLRPIFTKPEPASNPTTLQLQADDRQVVGWISGTRSLAGTPVVIRLDGGRTERTQVDRNNTFTWNYRVSQTTTVSFSVREETSSGLPLTGSLQLVPPPAGPEPSVFLIVDRTAYRPGQQIHFAGFLRTQKQDGEFVPLVKRAVDVELTSQRKGVKVAKLKLTSDEQGRVVGSYRFTDADALDTYNLALPGFKGGAQVLLGEYRKSKVKLDICGQLEGDKMKLTFKGLDFLDKPIVLTQASFVAQVVRRGKTKEFTLKGEDFVYHQRRQFSLDQLDNLSEEDLLLWEAEGLAAASFPGAAQVPLSQFQAELKPSGTTPAEYTFDVKPEWRRGDCAVVVQGVVTDSNGREQRASTTLPIEEKAEGSAPTVQLVLPKKHYFIGETIEVRTPGARAATLAVMKLAFQTPSATLSGIGTASSNFLSSLPAYRSARFRRYYPTNVQAFATAENVRRTLVNAVPVQDETAKVKITQPGAYKLIVVVPREDGFAWQQETTIVVKRLDETNALLMRLDREEIEAGEPLTGVLHSRFKNARVLLTVRDSTGIRLTQPVTVRDGVTPFSVKLPGKLRYGCTVDVAYPDEADHTYFTSKFVRVVPKDQMLTVEVDRPETVAPGATVELGLRVNRKEPVDLVVSVYDRSLLGIAADKSVDIRNFYLADERAAATLDRDMLQRRLSNVSISGLLRKAEDLLKEHKANPKKPPTIEVEALQALLSNQKGGTLYAQDYATLLRLAGIDVFFSPYMYGRAWYFNNLNITDRLIDLSRPGGNGWILSQRFIGNTLLLNEAHPSYINSGYPWHPVYGWNFGQGGYGGYGGYGNQLMLQSNLGLMGGYGGRGFARGDATWNMAVSGNSMHSFMPEAQGFISHVPSGPGAPVLLAGDGDQSHITVRTDFSDSAFWNATVRTDEQGQARVSVKLPDSLTNWQVVVTAVSRDMHVGSVKSHFRTYKPIMVWPMLPRTFTETDRVAVFASVHNRTDEPQTIKVRLKVENGRVLSPEQQVVKVGPKENVPVYWTFEAGSAGYTQLLMSADAPAGSDASLKRLPVVRAAAEQLVTVSGRVKDSTSFEIPEGVNLKDSRLEVSFAPSLAADMADTLNFLVDYPYGCVEQTMSRFLPTIKVAQLLRQFKVDHPELEKKLPGCVAGGIKRLLELQSGDGGWGWHGGGQTHEMMTPYALYGLLQAEKAGYQIPNEQAVNMGLSRLEQFINSMGDAQTADRVYCLYVFSHRRDLRPEWWTWLETRNKAKALSDYALALALEMAVAKRQHDLARSLAAQLRARAQKAGVGVCWKTAGFSRWAEDPFEITAQVLKAFVAHDKDEPLIDDILAFFVATKRGDRWNSTKDTAMILNAMCDYMARTEFNTPAMKSLTVAVNNGEKQTVRFDDQLVKKVVIPGEKLRAGKNVLTFKTDMSGVIYRVVFRYWKTGRDIPAMDHGLKVVRTFHLLDTRGQVVRDLKHGDVVPRGSYVMSRVQATHHLQTEMRYVLVESPRPAGGETVPTDDARFQAQQGGCTPFALREDREAMTCFHHEQTPHTLTDQHVYLMELAGEYVVPPARVEMMYHTETRGHSSAFVLKVEDAKK